jgi:hypothetical protein
VSVSVPAKSAVSGQGSENRKARLKIAGGSASDPPPPGCDEVWVRPGVLYAPAAWSQSPTPARIGTCFRRGFQALRLTRTLNWLRFVLTLTLGRGPPSGSPFASRSSALRPWTTRNSSAGDEIPAPSGHSTVPPPSPSAIVVATRFGSFRVLSVIRNAVALRSAFTRSSTRSAAFWA